MQHFSKTKRSELPRGFPDVLQFGGQPTQPAPCGLFSARSSASRPCALRRPLSLSPARRGDDGEEQGERLRDEAATLVRQPHGKDGPLLSVEPRLAFQFWSSSNSKFRKFDFKFTNLQEVFSNSYESLQNSPAFP